MLLAGSRTLRGCISIGCTETNPVSTDPMRSLRQFLLPLFFALLSHAALAQLRQIAMVDIPGRPGFDSMAFAGNYLVIAHRGANAVDIFDPRLRRLKTQITGIAAPPAARGGWRRGRGRQENTRRKKSGR